MADVNELARLKAIVSKAQENKNRAEGGLAEVMARLKEQFGCDTIEDAEKKLAKLQRRAEAAERKFEESVGAFRRKYEDVLRRP